MDHRSSMYPRGKVTKMQEMCLQLHKPFLMGEMDCREMVHRLRSKFIVSEHDEHFIFKAETQREQNGRLVDTIINRTARGFEVYMQVLQDTGHDAAYVKLFRTLENWQEGKEGVKEEEEEGRRSPHLSSERPRFHRRRRRRGGRPSGTGGLPVWACGWSGRQADQGGGRPPGRGWPPGERPQRCACWDCKTSRR